MNIKEYDIPHLNNKPPNFKKLNYPIPIKRNIQRPYFCCCSCGIRGSGKTQSTIRLLRNFEDSGFLNPDTNAKCDIRHILFTTTLGGNPIWNSLKYLAEDDIYEEYTNGLLEDILEEIKKERIYTSQFNDYVKAYKRFVKMTPQQYAKWEDKDAIIMLMSYDFADPKYIKQPKHPNGVITNIIFDDMLATDAFSRNKANTVLKLVLNGRHYASNVFILSQNIKSIPKAIRENTEVWSFFAFKSRKMVEDHLYELFGNLVTLEEFIALYEYATKKPHDSLVVDMKEHDPKDRFKINFDKIIRIEGQGDTPE